MKTKLLKIVRSRYSIDLTHGNDNPDSIYFEMKHDVYVVNDNRSNNIRICNDEPEAYVALVKMIRKDYYYTKKIKPLKVNNKKIWWKS